MVKNVVVYEKVTKLVFNGPPNRNISAKEEPGTCGTPPNLRPERRVSQEKVQFQAAEPSAKGDDSSSGLPSDHHGAKAGARHNFSVDPPNGMARLIDWFNFWV